MIGQLALASLQTAATRLAVGQAAETANIQFGPGDEKLLPPECTEVVLVPLVSQKGNIGGILLFYIGPSVTPLDGPPTDLLEILMSQTAVVIEDSRLFTTATRIAEQMRL